MRNLPISEERRATLVKYSKPSLKEGTMSGRIIQYLAMNGCSRYKDLIINETRWREENSEKFLIYKSMEDFHARAALLKHEDFPDRFWRIQHKDWDLPEGYTWASEEEIGEYIKNSHHFPPLEPNFSQLVARMHYHEQIWKVDRGFYYLPS